MQIAYGWGILAGGGQSGFPALVLGPEAFSSFSPLTLCTQASAVLVLRFSRSPAPWACGAPPTPFAPLCSRDRQACCGVALPLSGLTVL